MQPNSDEVERVFRAALREDIGCGDATTRALVPPGTQAQGIFAARHEVVACGAALLPRLFHLLDTSILCRDAAADGTVISPGGVLLRISGNAAPILSGERSALNILQRMCAVATLTRRYVDAAKGTKAVILDTRKTIPGLRALDKYATRVGGAQNHRFGLYDAILIKDNHLALCGGVKPAVQRAKAASSLPVIVECDTLAQVREALATEADRLLLDNMDNTQLAEAVRLAKGRTPLEASGNVTLETVYAIAQTGVDYISIGRLTHSAPAADIGLDLTLDT